MIDGTELKFSGILFFLSSIRQHEVFVGWAADTLDFDSFALVVTDESAGFQQSIVLVG